MLVSYNFSVFTTFHTQIQSVLFTLVNQFYYHQECSTINQSWNSSLSKRGGDQSNSHEAWLDYSDTVNVLRIAAWTITISRSKTIAGETITGSDERNKRRWIQIIMANFFESIGEEIAISAINIIYNFIVRSSVDTLALSNYSASSNQQYF